MRREIKDCVPSMASEDLYKITVDRDDSVSRNPLVLIFEFLGASSLFPLLSFFFSQELFRTMRTTAISSPLLNSYPSGHMN